MKKHGTLLLSGALALAVGAAVILGNGWAASRALAAGIRVDAPAIITNAGDTEWQGGQAYVPQPAEGSGEIAPKLTTVLKTLDNGEIIFVQYVADENGTWASVAYPSGAVQNLEGDAAAAAIERFGGPKRSLPDRYTEGEPGSGDISSEAAQNAATEALVNKYALKREILARFSVTAKFYSVYEDVDGAAWFVQLYPSDIRDFAEIGCYTAILNAETGDAIQLLSAADSRG